MKLPIWRLRAAEREIRREHQEHPTIWSAELVKRLDYWKSPWMRRKAIIEITEFSGQVYARLRQIDPDSPFLSENHEEWRSAMNRLKRGSEA